MNPSEFYLMERDDFWLLRRGYMDSRDEFRRDLRWAVTPLASIWAKGFDPYKHMAIHGDKKLSKGDPVSDMKAFAALAARIPKKKK